MNNHTVEFSHPQKMRSKVDIFLPDGRVISGPRGASVDVFLRQLPEWDNPPIMGAIVNTELRELTFPIDIESRVKPVTMSDEDGARIYRRSLTFLLVAAFHQLFPKDTVEVDHSLASGGYYCQAVNRPPLSEEEIRALEARMHELVRSDLPFGRAQVPLEEAEQYFQQRHETEKLRLLKYRSKDYLILYQLGDYRDYFHGYMVPSTGYLRWFGLMHYGNGFILRFTRRHSPTRLLPTLESSKLLATFGQYGRWLARLGIDSVGAMNGAIEANRIREVILISEALHEQKIADIASSVLEHASQARVVLIAGPSSSGKTTFSKRLSVQLLAQGVSPFPLELDNYFVDRAKTPKDEAGQYDYESLDALDITRLGHDLALLTAGEEVQLPRYNFRLGKSEPGDVIRLRKDQLIILEGIHGLNPNLLPAMPADKAFRIYVSCLTQLNLDRQNRIPTTDTRLLRRIVRDAATRGYTAHQTIQRWGSVQRGEKRWIFPFQENADEMFNSALVFELCVLKPLVEPLLRQVPYGTPEYVETKRLLAFLDWFLPVDCDLIPDNSILREFVGGSILAEFKVWQT